MRPALLATLVIAACAQFPDLDTRTTRAAMNAPYPSLVPTEALLAGLPPPERGEVIARGLSGRAAALRARAAALRARAVIDGATRARLQAAVARHSG
jgi:hypothetical protein